MTTQRNSICSLLIWLNAFNSPNSLEFARFLTIFWQKLVVLVTVCLHKKIITLESPCLLNVARGRYIGAIRRERETYRHCSSYKGPRICFIYIFLVHKLWEWSKVRYTSYITFLDIHYRSTYMWLSAKYYFSYFIETRRTLWHNWN